MFRFAQHDKWSARFNRSRSVVRRDSGPFGPKDCLLEVLNLLADLLQFGLAADDALGDCSVIRFRSERVEFPENLLCDEFKRAPNRLFAAQMVGKLSKMALKSCQLFRYISAIGEKCNLFQDALVLVRQR